MKKIFIIFLLNCLIACEPVLTFAQTDSTAVHSSGGLFGLSWLTIAGILGGAEVILRVLPIPQKYSILNAIAAIISIIPNNKPKE